MRLDNSTKWRDMPRWLQILVVFAMINFVFYMLVSMARGGDAWSGHIADGKYFVARGRHYTEVSRGFWRYSYYHTILLWLTHLATIVAGSLYFSTRRPAAA